MKNRFAVLFYLWCFAFPGSLLAQDTVAPKLEIIGKAAIEEGQFIKSEYTHLGNGSGNSGYSREEMPYRPWINNAISEVGLKATLNSHFSAVIIPQVRLWNDTWNWLTMGENGSAANPFIQHLTVSLTDAEGIIGFGNKETCAIKAQIGVMPFKYDENVKNLGEYLFRTGEHPAYIQNSFDYAYATMTGLRLNAEILKDLSVDVLLSQETQIIPINDWSLSFLVGYKNPLLDLGAGVMFDRLIPVAGKMDIPVFHGGAQDTFYHSDGTLDSLKWGGTKVMARVAIDPKAILPDGVRKIFGKEDGKIYAEAAILGLNSFTAYKKATDSQGKEIPGSYVVDSMMNFYSDITQRIPIMVGFNVPAFKLLDYLSVEVEWFGWPYSPSLYDYQNLVYTMPKPIIPKVSNNGIVQSVLYTKGNDWKFSFNVRKTIFGHFSVIGQIARDHTRHDAYYSSFADPEEVFLKNNEWGWWLKLQYSL